MRKPSKILTKREAKALEKEREAQKLEKEIVKLQKQIDKLRSGKTKVELEDPEASPEEVVLPVVEAEKAEIISE